MQNHQHLPPWLLFAEETLTAHVISAHLGQNWSVVVSLQCWLSSKPRIPCLEGWEGVGGWQSGGLVSLGHHDHVLLTATSLFRTQALDPRLRL
jgi:hypothetical protein